MKPFYLKTLINLYPPYLGTGISVRTLAPDFRYIRVDMKLRWFNRNYVNTHFGGSLYAMTDPFYMLMLMNILGNRYLVWDKSANIAFVKPGKGTVSAEFRVTDEQIDQIFRATAGGEKYLPEFTVDIRDADQILVARVIKQLYVRRKKDRSHPD